MWSEVAVTIEIVLKSVLSHLVLSVRWLYGHLPVLKIDEGYFVIPAPHGAMASVRAASEVLDSTIRDLFHEVG